MTELPNEITRVRELQALYAEMRGVPGVNVEPAIAMMEAGIQALAEGDAVASMRCWNALKGFKE